MNLNPKMLFQDSYMQNHFPAMDNSNYIYYAFAHLTFSTNPSFVDGSVEPSNLQHATSQKSRFSFLLIIGL